MQPASKLTTVKDSQIPQYVNAMEASYNLIHLHMRKSALFLIFAAIFCAPFGLLAQPTITQEPIIFNIIDDPETAEEDLAMRGAIGGQILKFSIQYSSDTDSSTLNENNIEFPFYFPAEPLPTVKASTKISDTAAP